MGGRDGDDDDDDDEYVPFIDIHHETRLQHLSVDGRRALAETNVATTIKHSKAFICCNVVVTALTLMLVAVALIADARHRASGWYRGAEYTVLVLLSLDLLVEVSFQGCRRFGCSDGGGWGGAPPDGPNCCGWCSLHRCLGCCLSWIQVGRRGTYVRACVRASVRACVGE